MAGHSAQRHIVVFDCNVYLDIGELLGPPFGWDEFNECAVRVSNGGVSGREADAVAALSVSTSGRFAGSELLEVWTSPHIDSTVGYKARQSTVPDPHTGLHGLGWTDDEATSLVDGLVADVVAMSGGGSVVGTVPDSHPPLDHEDGMVFGACRWLASEDPLARIYCVTRDRGFLDAYREGRLSTHTVVLTPSRFVSLVRAARAAKVRQSMSPRPAT